MLGIADRLGTVPSLRFDGQYIKTSRGIARFLDRIQPDPPLFPPDAEKRRAVEEAEKWADEIFQMAARRLLLVARVRGRDGLVNRGDDGRLGPLLFRSQRLRLLATQSIARFLAVNPDSAEEIDGALPGMLDRIDGWIETGLLHGEQLNAADFMIAPSLALITYRPDLRPELERRPLIGLVDRLLPEPVASRPRSRAAP
jgi:glutathione S-transferase